MKRVLLSALAIAICATTINFATAQGRTAPAGPTKIGLIDMAKVFKDYDKFKALRENLKAEIQRSDSKAKQLNERVQSLATQMKEMKPGGPGYAQLEKQLLTAQGELAAYAKGEQRDLMRKESQIYKQIYIEVTQAVAKYAQIKGYTLVIRFSPKGAEQSETPQAIVDSMNRQVIYHRPNDDITDNVLYFLNNQYKSTRAPARPRQ